ncbi:MAG: helix-turn-helix domain-containing protein [Candidatus Bathyarchaeota archaeon]|nr:helix-turn-helix domain-containing protein [Candidatus Bathyarchaeota archaeon]
MTDLKPADLEHISHTQLINLVKRGIVRIDMLTTLPINAMSKYDTPEYQRHSNVRGKSISIREASRKYNVPNPTISRWVRRGLIKIIARINNKIMIDEADVAYCADIRSQNPGAGRWLFNPDGTPYIK